MESRWALGENCQVSLLPWRYIALVISKVLMQTFVLIWLGPRILSGGFWLVNSDRWKKQSCFLDLFNPSWTLANPCKYFFNFFFVCVCVEFQAHFCEFMDQAASKVNNKSDIPQNIKIHLRCSQFRWRSWEQIQIIRQIRRLKDFYFFLWNVWISN